MSAPHLTWVSNATLALTESDLRALLWFKRKFFKAKSTANQAHVAYYILMMALSHPDLVEQWFDKLIYYSDVEGVDERKFLVDSVRRQRKYKRVKREVER